MNKTLFLWIALVCAIIIGALWQFYPLPDAQSRMDALPIKGTDFSGTNIPLSDFEKTFFVNVGILKRMYKVGNQNLFIYALDGTRNRHAVHDPFYCFRGAGYDIAEQKVVSIPGGTANLVHLTKDGMVRETLYWFSNGKQHFYSPMRYWWETTLRRITFGQSGPEPILIVVQPIDKDTLDWEVLPKQFPELFKI